MDWAVLPLRAAVAGKERKPHPPHVALTSAPPKKALWGPSPSHAARGTAPRATRLTA
jgi:hypothetical protein